MSVKSLNKVMLLGNLTRDPELKYTPSGTAVCTFGIATNRSWSSSDGSGTQEETEFHRVVAWAKLAEICSQLLYKGRKVYCEGRLQTRKWSGQDGVERSTTEIVIEDMIALGAPRGGGPSGDDYGNGGGQSTAVQPTQQQSDPSDNSLPEPEVVSDQREPMEAKGESKPQASDQEVDVDDIPF